jgi:hypothetical protein
MTALAVVMPDDITPELKQFVEHHIESVPQLEALFLLRNEPQRGWTASEIAKALYVPEDAAGSLLADFVRRGFAILMPAANQAYAYRPRDDDTDRLIGQLQAAYLDRRVAVISLIYSKPLNKVQTFADAFRFGKENPK